MTLQQLLQWRLARAEAEAPPPPRATHLLELARPWWETWPERFQSLVGRLGQLEVAYGHAMAETRRAPVEQFVPALIVRNATETEASVQILYFSVRNGELRLRFLLSGDRHVSEESYDVTFVSRSTSQPLFCAAANRSANGDYSLTEQLSDDLAANWSMVKVTDKMPFRLILRPIESRL